MTDCTLLLIIPINHSIFRNKVAISELVVDGKNRNFLPGTFSNGKQLAKRLGKDWILTKETGNYGLYTFSMNFRGKKGRGVGPGETSNYITFSDLTHFSFDVHCDQGIERRGKGEGEGEEERGAEGVLGWSRAMGGTGAEGIIEELLEIPCNMDQDVCQYSGVMSIGSQFDFLQELDGSQKYYILTALNTVSGVVGGPIAFTNLTEYSMALNILHIVVMDNLVTVLKSPSEINKIFYLNSSMAVIASVDLAVSKCCPDMNKGMVLFQKNDQEISWLSLDCLVEGLADVNGGGAGLSRQICELPLGGDIKCTSQLDAGKPFLNNNPAVFAFPWKINSFVLFGMDVCAVYNGVMINSFQEWVDALVGKGGWVLGAENTSVYFNYGYFDRNGGNGEDDLEKSSYSLMDAHGNLFYAEDLLVDCDDLGAGAGVEGGLELVYKFPGAGDVVRGGVKTIFDQLPTKEGQTFSCTTTIIPQCVIDDLNKAGVLSPWYFSAITLSGQEQMPVGNNFSTVAQLEAVLVQMGWKKVAGTGVGGGVAVYTITLSLEAPNGQSYVEITGCGNGSDKLVIDLAVSCVADCGSGNGNGDGDESGGLDLVLTKSEEGAYFWSAPSCFEGSGGGVVVNCGGTGLLGSVPDCDVVPKYDLKIRLKQTLIDVINCHFSSNGPYWLLSYKLAGGQVVLLNKNIGNGGGGVFSLQSLVECFVALGWLSSVDVGSINENTDEVTVTLLASEQLIHGVCLNLVGEYGNDLPFSYVIPITDICNITCLGLEQEGNKVLVKGDTGYCFVDLACIIPVIPPERDLDKELCDLPMCGEEDGDEFLFRICINLDICDVEKLRDAFGSLALVEIREYVLNEAMGGGTIPVHHNLGTVNDDSEVFLDQIIAAFVNGEGWTSPDVNARPVELNKETGSNISYVSFAIVGANPNIAPFPCLFPANCSEVVNCPSINPENYTMIKRPNGEVCWTPICPVAGPPGQDGETYSLRVDTGTGMTGPASSGPITIENSETLRVWSGGSIETSVNANALRLDANNMFFNGNGMSPDDNGVVPGDTGRLAIYYNGTELFAWNPDTQMWDSL